MDGHAARACALAAGLAASACRAPATTTATVQPTPAPAASAGAASAPRGAPGAAPGDTARRRGYTEADVRFMQHMIGHHAQALTMASLVPERSRRADLRLLAERITVSQRDEIATMQRWLRARGETVPEVADHSAHASHGASMPGMATPAELAALAALGGPAFDARFLELMIRHHEGALAMVAELFARPGAAQETQVFSIATEVDADQRAEIARMRALRATLPGG